MKLLMDPGVVLEELGIKDEDSILSEIRSRYDFRSSVCKQTPICLLPVVCLFIGTHTDIYIYIYIYIFREIEIHFFQGWNMARRNKFLNQ